MSRRLIINVYLSGTSEIISDYGTWRGVSRKWHATTTCTRVTSEYFVLHVILYGVETKKHDAEQAADLPATTLRNPGTSNPAEQTVQKVRRATYGLIV